jgi:hypothetical protein
MTNYQNGIMDLLQGETPKQKYEYLKELLKSKGKKFEVGAKAKVVAKKNGHEFDYNEVITLIDKQTKDDGWLCCAGNQKWYVNEDEMELI